MTRTTYTAYVETEVEVDATTTEGGSIDRIHSIRFGGMDHLRDLTPKQLADIEAQIAASIARERDDAPFDAADHRLMTARGK